MVYGFIRVLVLGLGFGELHPSELLAFGSMRKGFDARGFHDCNAFVEQAVMEMAIGEGTRKSSWQYACEALPNLECLRLFLFSSHVCPLYHCLNFVATLHRTPASSSPLPSVLCRWQSADDGTWIRLLVPLPACLLDHSAPLFFWTREDHIEVKIGLLSLNTYFHALLGLASGEPPVENAAEDDVLRYGKDSIPFSLDRGTLLSLSFLSKRKPFIFVIAFLVSDSGLLPQYWNLPNLFC